MSNSYKHNELEIHEYLKELNIKANETNKQLMQLWDKEITYIVKQNNRETVIKLKEIEDYIIKLVYLTGNITLKRLKQITDCVINERTLRKYLKELVDLRLLAINNFSDYGNVYVLGLTGYKCLFDTDKTNWRKETVSLRTVEETDKKNQLLVKCIYKELMLKCYNLFKKELDKEYQEVYLRKYFIKYVAIPLFLQADNKEELLEPYKYTERAKKQILKGTLWNKAGSETFMNEMFRTKNFMFDEYYVKWKEELFKEVDIYNYYHIFKNIPDFLGYDILPILKAATDRRFGDEFYVGNRCNILKHTNQGIRDGIVHLAMDNGYQNIDESIFTVCGDIEKYNRRIQTANAVLKILTEEINKCDTETEDFRISKAIKEYEAVEKYMKEIQSRRDSDKEDSIFVDNSSDYKVPKKAYINLESLRQCNVFITDVKINNEGELVVFISILDKNGEELFKAGDLRKRIFGSTEFIKSVHKDIKIDITLYTYNEFRQENYKAIYDGIHQKNASAHIKPDKFKILILKDDIDTNKYFKEVFNVITDNTTETINQDEELDDL